MNQEYLNSMNKEYNKTNSMKNRKTNMVKLISKTSPRLTLKLY